MPAVPTCITDSSWDEFYASIPPVRADRPSGCHWPHAADQVGFDKLVQVLALPPRG